MKSGRGLSPAALKAFLDGPSSKAPAGIVPNLVNPPNRNGQALAIAVVCILLTTAATLTRLYSRIFIVRRLRIEDYLGLCAFLPFVANAWSFFDFRDQAGFFVHQWDLRGQVLVVMGYNSFVFNIAYCLMMMLLKTAILLEWKRIFVLDQTHNKFFWLTMILMVLNIAIYGCGFITTLASCQPFEKLWHFWVDGKCINRKARDIVNAVFNLTMDIFILILPQRMVWRLQMSKGRRIGISIVFSMGLLVVALASGRLYSTVTLQYPDDLTKPFDTTYTASQTMIWVFCETTCIFLVFCVPVLPKLVANNSLVLKLAASWRSWTRLAPPSDSKVPNNDVWPPTIGSARNAPRRAPDPQYSAHANGETQHSEIELPIMRDVYTEQVGNGDGKPSDPSIVKTVGFDRHDDAASKISTTPFKKEQHPWME